MKHPIHFVTDVTILSGYMLRIKFEDGAVRDIDLGPVLKGELYGPLRDPGLFGQVRIDPEVRTIVWPNGADFAPATLHDWDVCGPILAGKARDWEP